MSTSWPVSIRSKPCRSRSLAYSASSSAPAIQPVQRSMLRRPSSLTGFWIVTSAIWMRPPGREHAEELGEDGVLVGDQVDDAVRDHDVEARVRERQLLGLALDELDVRRRPSRRRPRAPWRASLASCRSR